MKIFNESNRFAINYFSWIPDKQATPDDRDDEVEKNTMTTTQIKHQLVIPKDYAGHRLDQALAALLPQYSRSRIKQWIQTGQITINQNIWRPKDKVSGLENVLIEASLEEDTHLQAEAMDVSIIYEDDDILVIDKPAGLIVHPGAGIREHTLLNALLYHTLELAKLPRTGLIHRLDKDTSGLLVIAKNMSAHTHLVKALQKRLICREYEAIVVGTLTGGGTVDAPIGRHPKLRTCMAVVESGRPAITHYRILKRFQNYTHLKIQLETGRTHQIRVHMAHIHHQVVGDPLYGRMQLPKQASDALIQAIRQFKRQALHANRLSFMHPVTKKLMTFQSELPEDMQDLLEMLGKEDKIIKH
jgi:23S rRNA pseudouridine1911/1915/1917 synthase